MNPFRPRSPGSLLRRKSPRQKVSQSAHQAWQKVGICVCVHVCMHACVYTLCVFVECSSTIVRTSHLQSRAPGFKSSSCHFKDSAIPFTWRCYSLLSFISGQLAIDSDEHMRMKSLRSNCSMAECSPEKSSWYWKEQVCQWVRRKRPCSWKQERICPLAYMFPCAWLSPEVCSCSARPADRPGTGVGDSAPHHWGERHLGGARQAPHVWNGAYLSCGAGGGTQQHHRNQVGTTISATDTCYLCESVIPKILLI